LKQVATFRKNDPIVLGVDVEEGVLKPGTPICVYSKDVTFDVIQLKDKDKIKIGVVESIESNHKKIK
jgi:translation initiation factor 5B